MTLLLFFKPIIHQGPSAGVDTSTKRKKSRKARPFVKRLAARLDLPEVDVTAYVEEVMAREREVTVLKQRRAEEEAQAKISELIDQVGQMVRRQKEVRRKRLAQIVASIMEWL